MMQEIRKSLLWTKVQSCLWHSQMTSGGKVRHYSRLYTSLAPSLVYRYINTPIWKSFHIKQTWSQSWQPSKQMLTNNCAGILDSRGFNLKINGWKTGDVTQLGERWPKHVIRPVVGKYICHYCNRGLEGKDSEVQGGPWLRISLGYVRYYLNG